MNNEPPINDPQLMWQSLQREHSLMSIDEVRVRARDTYAKLRRTLVIGFVLGALVLVLSTIAIITIPLMLGRVLAVVLMALTVLIGYNTYSRLWPSAIWADVAQKGCVTFYRRELEAQHRSLQITWRFLAAVVVLAFLTRNFLIDEIPANARILVPGVLAVIIFERRYQAWKIKRKLLALDAFEEENS